MLPTTAATRMLAVVTTLVGVSLIALFTANIVSFFVDNDERELRREVRLDLKHLRDKVEALRAGHAGQSVTGPTAGIAAGDRGDVRVEPVDEHARLLAEMAVLRESIEALRSALQAGLAEVRAGRQGEAER
jgi:hypothetical protein